MEFVDLSAQVTTCLLMMCMDKFVQIDIYVRKPGFISEIKKSGETSLCFGAVYNIQSMESILAISDPKKMSNSR